MSPETLKLANELTQDTEALQCALDRWEHMELPTTPSGASARHVLYLDHRMPRQAFLDFKRACQTELQRAIEANVAKLKGL